MTDANNPAGVLIVGASGFLGSNIALAAAAAHRVVLHSSSHAVHLSSCATFTNDLLVDGAADELIERAAVDTVVNCAALANVDACERDPQLADRLNAHVPGMLAEACARRGVDFVHISSDAVFGGAPGPFTVDTPPSPINEYGRSKLAGERAVLDRYPRALVVRTNIIGWSPSGQRSLLEFFWNRLSAGTPTPGFTDVFFRPVAASDLWPLIDAWLREQARVGHAGIRHATGTTLLSKHDFGRRVARTFGFDESLVTPSTVSQAGLTSARAPSLDVEPSSLPLEADPSLPMPDIDSALRRLRGLADSGYRDRLAEMVQPSTRSS